MRRRLAPDIQNLVGTNQVSISRGVNLSHNAVAAGAERSTAVVPPEWRYERDGKNNLARNYRKWVGRNSQWPHPYFANIRLNDPKTNQANKFWVALMLPHELMDLIIDLGQMEAITDLTRADPLTRAYVEEMRAKLSEPNLIGLGLWGDEVPCFWDRSESITALTIFQVCQINGRR